MRTAASAGAELSSLLARGAAQGARALAGLVGGEGKAGPLFELEAERLAGWEAGVAFEVGGGVAGAVVVLFAARARDRVLAALGSAALADPASALAEVGNIVASQAVSAIADALGARVTLSAPQLAERSSGPALARALRSGAPAFAAELGVAHAGSCALFVHLPGGLPRSAIP